MCTVHWDCTRPLDLPVTGYPWTNLQSRGIWRRKSTRKSQPTICEFIILRHVTSQYSRTARLVRACCQSRLPAPFSNIEQGTFCWTFTKFLVLHHCECANLLAYTVTRVFVVCYKDKIGSYLCLFRNLIISCYILRVKLLLQRCFKLCIYVLRVLNQ